MHRLQELCDRSHALQDQQLVPRLMFQVGLEVAQGGCEARRCTRSTAPPRIVCSTRPTRATCAATQGRKANSLQALLRREAQQRKLQVGRRHSSRSDTPCQQQLWLALHCSRDPAADAAFVHCVQAQAERCLNNDELRVLGSLLQEHATLVCLQAAPDGSSEAEELRINYDGFSSVRALACVCVCAALAPLVGWQPTAGGAERAMAYHLALLLLLPAAAGGPQGAGAPRHLRGRRGALHAARPLPAL
jgi:hypothetical protein